LINNLLKLAIFIFAVFSSYACGTNESGKRTDNSIKDIFNEYDGKYIIFISKKDFFLYVYDRDLAISAKFKIGYGLNPEKKPKLFAGDNNTPEGLYKITEILSMDVDKNSESYKKLLKMNSIFFKAKDGHYRYGKKEADLGNNAYGPRFFRIDYPNQNDVQRYNDALKRGMIPTVNGRAMPIGSGLAIHGTCDEESIGRLGSSGCIRMYNRDIAALDRYIKLNLPVIISSD
jgi:murein L,D-transpeptidase YafK